MYEELIVCKANQFVQSRLNASVPTLDSSKSTQSLVDQQRARIKELARQAVSRLKREEAEQRVKAEGRPPTDDDFRFTIAEDEIQSAAVAIAESVVSAASAQVLIDQQTLEGLRRGV